MLKLKLLVTVAIVALLFGVAGANVLLDRVVAVVNDEVITWSELYKSMESEAPPQVKEMKEEEKRKVLLSNEASYLESLINLKLQLQEARGMGMSVSDEEVKEGIENIKKKYSMTESSFLDSLRKEGYSPGEYKRRLREQILISKVINMRIRSKIVIGEDDVSNYLTENKEFADYGEAYRLGQIFFKRPKSDSDKAKVEEKASEVLKMLKDGKDFAEVARKYSEDSTAVSGGDLGLVRRKQLLKEFAEALTKIGIGEVSAPFWTERGLHIIKLTEKMAPKDKNEIREEARNSLSDRVFLEKYNSWIKSLREKAFIEIRL